MTTNVASEPTTYRSLSLPLLAPQGVRGGAPVIWLGISGRG
jgi:hypothetical protein